MKSIIPFNTMRTEVVGLTASKAVTRQAPLSLDVPILLPGAPLRYIRFSNSSYSACGPIQNQYTWSPSRNP